MPHINELYDFTIGAIIIHDSKVLLINHPRYNKWLTPGGHIELDEDPETALYREIEEETGLNVQLLHKTPDPLEDGVKPLPIPDFMDVHPAQLPHRHIGLFYVATTASNQNVLSDEHTDFAWISESDIDDPKYNLGSSLKHYIRQALAMVAQQ